MTARTVHDVVVGKPGPARNSVVGKLLDADRESSSTESWLIDMRGVHPALSDWAGRNLNVARTMLAGLNQFRPGNRDRDLCVTIEDASVALMDPRICRNLEKILRGAATASVKFRLVVESLDVSSFGGSKVICDEVLAGNVIEAVSRG